MNDSITIRKSGPIFDGRAQAVVGVYLDEATDEVADQGVNDVHAVLGTVLKNPTGYYESRIVTDVSRSEISFVTDSGVIYGSWLEGTSSRNQSTRFKGYTSFRKATQVLDTKASAIAERILSRYIGRMN